MQRIDRPIGYSRNNSESNNFLIHLGGYSLTLSAAGGGRGSVSIFGVRNLTLDQYLRSVNYKIDHCAIFGVHKSEERKNCAVWLDLFSDPVGKCCCVYVVDS